MMHAPVSPASAEAIHLPQGSVDLTAAIQQTQQDPAFRYLQEKSDPLDGLLQQIFEHPAVKRFQTFLVQQLDQFFASLGSLLSKLHLPNTAKVNTALLDQAFQTTLNLLLIFMGIIFVYFILQWLLRAIQALQKAFQKKTLPQPLETNRAELEAFDTYWKEASRYEALGNFSEASRSLYWAFLGYLSENNLLSYLSARSNQEYVHFLRAHQRFLNIFQPIAQLFEGVHYGKKSVTTAQYTACKEPFEALLAPHTESRYP